VALRAHVPPLPFDGAAAAAYRKLHAHLTRVGKLVGPMDLLIAAHALSAGLTLVTDNTAEFRRVKNLQVENWAREP
jgi:tRNA(fMet)-specific endonuclease VapC